MTTPPAPSLGAWADAQARISAVKMAECVSPTSIVKQRPGFGQTIRPAKGSVIAAIGSAHSETEPDYFFHWLRDSAAIMDAALVLIRRGIDAEAWKLRFADFVRFSLDLRQISGSRFLRETPDLRERTAPKLRQFIRPDAELAAVEGESVPGEVRYNADGTIDFLKWSRPQHDGLAARALVALRFVEANAVADDALASLAELIRLDLDYTAGHAGEPCYDIWEEDLAQHYYTCLVQFAALAKGADWAQARGDADYAARLNAAAGPVRDTLDGFWSAEKGHYLSRLMPDGQASAKALDFAAMLGVLHAGLATGTHSIADERVLQTLNRLEALFATDYAINRRAGAGLALGRYSGDVYFSGGAYFFCTFGAAEYYYKLAAAKADASLIAKGDAILDMARRSIPPSGEISEQFDQTTGEQTSAKSLTWSYASFLTAWDARKHAHENTVR
jgi:glucoamylase